MNYNQYINSQDFIIPVQNFNIEQLEPFFINPKGYQKEKKKKEKKNERCMTCKPRGKVKNHIIGKSLCSNFIFHHDMQHRPIILLTPVEHITDIKDLPVSPFKAIEDFCSFWNINGYQVSFNYGSWKVNDHFHIKIKIDDKIAERMRGDHFRKLKLEKNYIN
jgi:hypothetical protein